MRRLFAAVAVASFLALGACANVSPVQQLTEAVCKDGVSVGDVLKEQQAKHPDYNVHIENVAKGEVVATLLAGTGLKADSIVVLGAVLEGKPSGGVLLLAVDGPCVVGRKGVQREQAIAYGLLGDKEAGVNGHVQPNTTAYLPVPNTVVNVFMN